MSRGSASAPFAVLIVCTGNICRSPLAEQLLRARADEFARSLGVDNASRWITFASAGTHGNDGDTMPRQAAELSVRYGGDPSEHAATRLWPVMIDSADLVLGLARTHRSEIVSMLPRSSRYAFTLLEFARLLDDLTTDSSLRIPMAAVNSPADLLRTLVSAVAARRGIAPRTTPEADDVVDPYRRSQKTYDLSGASIDAAITSIFDSLTTLTDAPIVTH